MPSELPDGYAWGVSRLSRFIDDPVRHVLGPDGHLVCRSGGIGLQRHTQGLLCPQCATWLRRHHH